MRLVRGGSGESAALEISLTHALLLRVAAGALPSMLRLYRPSPTVAFGRLDALRPGFPAAVRAARRHGFEPVLRPPGGHAAAYHHQSLGIDLVMALEDPIEGTHDRFREAADRIAGALVELGVDARVGAVPGEYCPGAYSVNARGRVKLVGTAQRLVRRAALLGAVIVVRDGARVRDVLRDVYERLELDWDDATAGAVAEEVAGVGVPEVEHAVEAAYADLEEGALDEETWALARRLQAEHELKGV